MFIDIIDVFSLMKNHLIAPHTLNATRSGIVRMLLGSIHGGCHRVGVDDNEQNRKNRYR